MSKTLTLKKLDAMATGDGQVTLEQDATPVAPTIETFSEEQLMEQLLKLRGEKPLPPRPPGFQGIWDHTSMLPVVSSGKVEIPADAQVGFSPQLPPKTHGSFSLNGIPLIAPGVNQAENINPATGLPYAQVTTAPKGGMISPPPSRNFRG